MARKIKQNQSQPSKLRTLPQELKEPKRELAVTTQGGLLPDGPIHKVGAPDKVSGSAGCWTTGVDICFFRKYDL